MAFFNRDNRSGGRRRFGGRRDLSPRRFEDRAQRRSDFEQRGNRPQNDDQFKELNSKLDKIIYLLQSQIPKKPEETIPDIGVEEIIKMPNPPADEPVLSPKKKTKKSKKTASTTPEEKSSPDNES